MKTNRNNKFYSEETNEQEMIKIRLYYEILVPTEVSLKMV